MDIIQQTTREFIPQTHSEMPRIIKLPEADSIHLRAKYSNRNVSMKGESCQNSVAHLDAGEKHPRILLIVFKL